MYFKKILGDRIYLSPRGSSEEEAKKYTEWMNDFQISDCIGRTAQVTNLLCEQEYLVKTEKNPNNYYFSIIELENDKIIGTISLENINWSERSGVLGIFIGDENYRNNKYGTEAIKLILEYGFKYINLHSIRLVLLSINERAHQCYLKCGFKDTGCSREEIYLNGKYYDKLHMDILNYEFSGDYIRNKHIK